MSSKAYDEDWYEPPRDERGRYIKGFTGNRTGRPPKRPERPKSLAQCVADHLAREIAVNDNGTRQLLSYREVMVTTLLRSALKAKPREILHIIERVERLAAEVTQVEESEEGVFTEEDRRLLEILSREVDEQLCCQCDKPPPINSDGRSRREDSKFD